MCFSGKVGDVGEELEEVDLMEENFESCDIFRDIGGGTKIEVEIELVDATEEEEIFESCSEFQVPNETNSVGGYGEVVVEMVHATAEEESFELSAEFQVLIEEKSVVGCGEVEVELVDATEEEDNFESCAAFQVPKEEKLVPGCGEKRCGVLFPAEDLPSVEVGKSNIKQAGNGLFSSKRFIRGDNIGDFGVVYVLQKIVEIGGNDLALYK